MLKLGQQGNQQFTAAQQASTSSTTVATQQTTSASQVPAQQTQPIPQLDPYTLQQLQNIINQHQQQQNAGLSAENREFSA